MITVKRNIKKKDNNNQKLVIKIPKDVEYTFPYIDKVDPGQYVSEIAFAMESKTRSNEPSFDICYYIIDYYDYVKYLNNKKTKKECKIHKIRQRYIVGSDVEREFSEAMYNVGFDDEFELDELIGVQEVIRIEYKNNNSLGGIEKRVPYNCMFQETEDEDNDEESCSQDVYYEQDEYYDED